MIETKDLGLAVKPTADMLKFVQTLPEELLPDLDMNRLEREDRFTQISDLILEKLKGDRELLTRIQMQNPNLIEKEIDDESLRRLIVIAVIRLIVERLELTEN